MPLSQHPNSSPWGDVTFPHALWLAAALLSLTGPAKAAQFTVNGPGGSGEFGRSVTTLPNGNLVVSDPLFDAPGPIVDAGAVHLYRPNGALISTLRGSSANDRVGSGGIVVLPNGRYLVRSPSWRNGAADAAGAVTFVSGSSGISGEVSASNSLVGGTAGDQVSSSGITVLSNGNYVVTSTAWDNGTAVDAGAVTFGSGSSGISGAVSAVNSLVGSSELDQVGRDGVTALSNGNYVVSSGAWDNGAQDNAGAVTFGNGATGVRGVVSAANSLVGGSVSDQVGFCCVIALANGNYLVQSPF